MLTIAATEAWRQAHPGALIGLLEIAGLDNTGGSPALAERQREIETRLREQYRGLGRRDFLALPVMAVYDRYYGRFNKTYHVQLQLESIVLKGKPLPNVSPAVDANFMTEVETLILTAGHDAQRLREPIWIDVARDGEPMTSMAGPAKALRAGDMVMRDADGVCCSILYGQDARSPITPATTHVLYVAYGPAGLTAEMVERQLRGLAERVRLFAAEAVVVQQRLLTA